MADDAAFIAAALAKLADDGQDIVLVAHSYGGIPATEALNGLAKGQRMEEGKEGGVVRVAYLSALMPGVGGCAGTALEGCDFSYVRVDVSCPCSGLC
jgi:pimeloyl-ACP methyl ester carboxylesterase